MTDFYSPRLDKPNPRALAEIVLRAALSSNDSLNEDHGDIEANQRRQLFDRLPTELMRFVTREFSGRPRDTQFWNRVRDSVSAHFNPAWTDSDEYRAYLRLMIRRHGFQEGPSLLPEVQEFLNELKDSSRLAEGDRNPTPSPEGINPQLLSLKAEDLAQEILEDSRRASRRAPKRGPRPPERDR